MANADFDVSQLSDSQQSALGTYTSVTNQEIPAAVSLLERSQWNVQIAIAKFFDGEAPDPLEEARASLASNPIPAQTSQRETLLNGSPRFRGQSRGPIRDPAPRIVPQSETRSIHRLPFILSLFLTPFNLLYRLLSGSVRFFNHLFPLVPRLLPGPSNGTSRERPQRDAASRRPLSPKETTSRFARQFEEEYGANSLPFFEGSYAQAYDLAKRDLKFLLVVLISPEHEDTSSFVQTTLLSQEVASYISDPRNKVILWAGNVQDTEAYQVSTALNCTKFPFAAVVAHTPQDSSTSMSTITRISGLVPPASFTSRLQTVINQHSAILDQARTARNEQQAARNLREEQNSAYERSLAQDRERARQRREEQEGRIRAEQEKKAKVEADELNTRKLEQWRKWRAQSISREPGPNMKEVTRVSIRMTSGERVVRRFAVDTDLEELYAFAECYDTLQQQNSTPVQKPGGYNHSYGFRLVSPIPRTVYSLADGGTIGSKIGRSGNLLVELIDDEDDDA
ncbi:MAG: hypothetical protein Q9214_000968 [Letrouitia sp. 1 TL-2023]